MRWEHWQECWPQHLDAVQLPPPSIYLSVAIALLLRPPSHDCSLMAVCSTDGDEELGDEGES
ncbi:MAG: hypothetical protein F6K36_29925 [Symploca sp. SIO3C6]|nr:hypothetical protein [Symploca sp. SIO3C6]